RPTAVFSQSKADEMAQGIEARKQMLPPAESIYMVEDGYMGAHFDHFMNFFRGVRNGSPVNEDAEFGLRAAAPALACNDSYFGEQVVSWDPVKMEVM
ncbi:MAG: gfo/Idh/MocA family oxidoreductase, partial [Gemmatimonadetes bacterium]|nr:gfo/Idh/MocA family oxidoreductase [Gemmatimonadota bacterium]